MMTRITLPTLHLASVLALAVLGVRWASYDRDTASAHDTVKAALHAAD
jgi:hypothetical protein